MRGERFFKKKRPEGNRYVRLRRVWFLRRFGLKTGIDFGLESGIVFEETNSKRIRKKEKYANSKWILRNLFCWRSNPSNGGIIYKRPGLKTGVKNITFFGLK